MRTDTPTRGVQPSRFGESEEHGTTSAIIATPKSSAFVRVADGGVWTRIPASAGLRVVGVSGHLWITQAGDPGDATVAPGEAFVTRGRGKVVVQALGDATFRVEDHV